jgi:hypothetical protein
VAFPNLLSPTRFKRRLGGGLTALALTAGTIGALGATAAPAAADQQCTGRPEVNVCIDIFPVFDGRSFHIHVGIDVHMSQQAAQAYVDQGRPFTVTMMGSDPVDDDTLFNVPMSAIGASAESGLGADFDVAVAQFSLDEDDSIFDDVDEVYARIVLRDARSGRSFTYLSDTVTQVF